MLYIYAQHNPKIHTPELLVTTSQQVSQAFQSIYVKLKYQYAAIGHIISDNTISKT